MRTFIALEIPDTVKNRLEKFVHQMKLSGGSVRWVKPQDVHLTLKFLGEVNQEQVSRISSLLDQVVSGFSNFSLHIAGTGTFPHSSPRPRVIWAGISQEPLLSALQADLEKALLKSGFPLEKRSFWPHLTLGRVKSSQGIKPLVKNIQENAHIVFGSMPVNQIHLFKSELMPAGAEYSKIHTTDLSS